MVSSRSGTATVTILFTHVVRSTELSERLGDEGAQEMRRIHFRLLRDAVASHGGYMASRTRLAWGRWLLRAGARAPADAKFDELAELYRSAGVGQRFFDRLEQIRRGG